MVIRLIDQFQSTPPHGGRRKPPDEGSRPTSCFNPRPRTGGDLASTAQDLIASVSIHAPARGATSAGARAFVYYSRFNPRPRTGGDSWTAWRSAWMTCFNPRPRTGGDERQREYGQRPEVFQSTPPHGGRLELLRMGFTFRGVSIHAPARGATGRSRRACVIGSRFNPRPRTGGDCTPRRRRRRPAPSFNPRPRHGGRRRTRRTPAPSRRFQSTPPHGGRRDQSRYG